MKQKQELNDTPVSMRLIQILEQVEPPWEAHILKSLGDDDDGRDYQFDDKGFESKLREIIDGGGQSRYIELQVAGGNGGHVWGMNLVFVDFLDAKTAMETIESYLKEITKGSE